MLGLAIGAGVIAGGGYLAGTVLHEVSHVAAVIATGSTLDRVRWRQTLVEYEPRSRRADAWIKATPVLLTPMLLGGVLLSVSSVWGIIVALGLLGGFAPRDLTEYWSVGQLLVAGTQT